MSSQSIREKGNRIVDGIAAKIVEQFRNNRALCWITGALMVLLSLYLRSTMYYGGDSAFYFVRAQQILAGKKYYHDFFEPNFPLNFYITALPVMLYQATGISKVMAATVFVTIIQLISIFCSHKILKRTSLYQDTALYNLIFMAIFLGQFLPVYTMPINEFGTKTVLFFSFILPYFCYVFCEVEDKPLAPLRASLIGIFAGLTICLKPDFAVFPLLMEATIFMRKRKVAYLFRPLNIAILVTNLLHLAWLIIFIPEFLKDIIPMAMVSYPGTASNVIDNFLRVGVRSQIYGLVLVGYFYARAKRSPINDLLVLGVVASTIVRSLHAIDSMDQNSIPGFFIGLVVVKLVKDVLQRDVVFKWFDIPIVVTCFLIVVIILVNGFDIERKEDSFAHDMIAVLQDFPKNTSVYGLSGPDFIFLLQMHSDVTNDNKIGNLYLLKGVEESLIVHPHDNKTAAILKTKQYIIQSIIEGVTKNHPKIIFLEGGGLNPADRCYEDYVTYFSRVPAFREVWNDYVLAKRLRKNGKRDMLVLVRRDSRRDE